MARVRTIIASLLFALGTAVFGSSAHADLVQALFDGPTDCGGGGQFGSNFATCSIFINDNGQTIQLSPVIAKFDNEDNFGLGEAELNTGLYPSISGTEFNVDGQDSASGTWTYTPGENDPGVRYWAVISGTSVLLHWIVNDATALTFCTGGSTNNVNYNLDCLQGAEAVTSGDWFTATGQAISHITFYDTKGVQVVPLPPAILLLATALFGLIGVARIRRARASV